MDIQILVSSILTASIPLLLAGLGEVVAERSGVLNLSTEGAMSVAAVVTALVAIYWGTPWPGLVAGILAGLGWTLFFFLLAECLKADQIIVGIALSIAGLGLSAIIGRGYEGYTVPELPSLRQLSEVLPPLDVAAPLLLLAPIVIHIFLKKTRTGLAIRAVGDNPSAADSFGIDVTLTRLQALIVDGILVGLAGSYLILVATPRWVEGVTGGRGWIAIALAPFSYWEPLLVYLGALLFASLEVMQYVMQALAIRVPRELLLSMPYIALIVALTIMRSPKLLKKAPRALGQYYIRR